jgi:hypothetical protein
LLSPFYSFFFFKERERGRKGERGEEGRESWADREIGWVKLII